MTRKTKRSDDITLLATPELIADAQDGLTVGSWLEHAGFARAATATASLAAARTWALR